MARGDADFIAFAEASSARLQRAAYLLTGDQHQAEEAAQATLVRVYAAWGRVRRKDPYAYARTVLTNLVTDQWRRPMREYATETMPDRQATEDVADVVSKRRWLIGALQALSPRERAVIVLRHFFDASEAEVSRELDLSAGTVKSLNSRALAKLRITVGSVPPLRTETEAGAGL
ncbi:SigE family RNA polymerase sigma factor [Actinoplanes couchii]|uniref:DNA-directed RNA polymerase sigma-70 factor n=1 Tax=Actinoplanes couchii TaxID=403638 RepID=A0ABQ3X885_9ACTN|nr:SigE family RNA polymerase sigma factor [Actinoplanes couchii]MDR6320283.1 RNA polymerase sigma-70 factor (sigma-E family) [Actinoplanes couchii]GID54702.1 DNA-directed RNA polymerase sigma-70 factor [Actinoplanes couchii]